MPSTITSVKFFDFQRKRLRYKKEINASVERVFGRGWFIAGPELADFEQKFAKYLGARYVVGVNSGTDSIVIALKAIGIKMGDEVITTAHTATPTVAAIRVAGAIPVFVDIDENTLNIDPAFIEKKITPKTKAILPVHLYGYPADMDIIKKIAVKNKLFLVEDACQSHGASFRGKKLGTIGDVGCFSFYPTKNLGAFGDAGAVVTNNKKIADSAMRLRNFGEVSRYKNKIEGINSRIDEIQAAFLNWGIKELDKWNKERAKIAGIYLKELKNLPMKLPPKGDESFNRVWHLFVIQTDRRDVLREFLKKRGIETLIHYPTPIFKQEAYKFLGYEEKDLPVTTGIHDKILSLPIYPELTVPEVKFICNSIREFYGNRKTNNPIVG
ncbi:MAG: DegT/DnrJ/EryC1/StrS family aminotransferase [Patescibacteria group bacterium]